MTQRRIIIVGFMGSGKSTVARALAERLHSNVIDLDEEIKQTVGRSPKQIIEEDGEPAFRETETQILDKVLRDNPAPVMALGGGAWALAGNRILIEQEKAVTVWLDAPFDLCWERIETSSNARPLARTQSQAQELYEKRRPAYSLADLHVGASESKSADQIAEEIIRELELATRNS